MCVCVCVCVCVCHSVVSTLCDPMDCRPSGSSLHGIFQARILKWVAISYFRGSSRPRDQTHVSGISYVGRWILYYCTTLEAHSEGVYMYKRCSAKYLLREITRREIFILLSYTLLLATNREPGKAVWSGTTVLSEDQLCEFRIGEPFEQCAKSFESEMMETYY